MNKCVVAECELDEAGWAWIAFPVDNVPSGYIEVEAPICSVHYPAMAKLPNNVVASVKVHF